jgi:hypothetical protein
MENASKNTNDIAAWKAELEQQVAGVKAAAAKEKEATENAARAVIAQKEAELKAALKQTVPDQNEINSLRAELQHKTHELREAAAKERAELEKEANAAIAANGAELKMMFETEANAAIAAKEREYQAKLSDLQAQANQHVHENKEQQRLEVQAMLEETKKAAAMEVQKVRAELEATKQRAAESEQLYQVELEQARLKLDDIHFDRMVNQVKHIDAPAVENMSVISEITPVMAANPSAVESEPHQALRGLGDDITQALLSLRNGSFPGDGG